MKLAPFTPMPVAVRQAIAQMQRENARIDAMRNCCSACRAAAESISLKGPNRDRAVTGDKHGAAPGDSPPNLEARA